MIIILIKSNQCGYCKFIHGKEGLVLSDTDATLPENGLRAMPILGDGTFSYSTIKKLLLPFFPDAMGPGPATSLGKIKFFTINYKYLRTPPGESNYPMEFSIIRLQHGKEIGVSSVDDEIVVTQKMYKEDSLGESVEINSFVGSKISGKSTEIKLENEKGEAIKWKDLISSSIPFVSIAYSLTGFPSLAFYDDDLFSEAKANWGMPLYSRFFRSNTSDIPPYTAAPGEGEEIKMGVPALAQHFFKNKELLLPPQLRLISSPLLSIKGEEGREKKISYRFGGKGIMRVKR